jgi:hypothetical protein
MDLTALPMVLQQLHPRSQTSCEMHLKSYSLPSTERTDIPPLLTLRSAPEHDKQFADDADKCEAIVSAWKIGGGVEMKQYGPAMYLEMFGREYGWILYRETRMSIHNESNVLLRRPLCTFRKSPVPIPIPSCVGFFVC